MQKDKVTRMNMRKLRQDTICELYGQNKEVSIQIDEM